MYCMLNAPLYPHCEREASSTGEECSVVCSLFIVMCNDGESQDAGEAKSQQNFCKAQNTSSNTFSQPKYH